MPEFDLENYWVWKWFCVYPRAIGKEIRVVVVLCFLPFIAFLDGLFDSDLVDTMGRKTREILERK